MSVSGHQGPDHIKRSGHLMNKFTQPPKVPKVGTYGTDASAIWGIAGLKK